MQSNKLPTSLSFLFPRIGFQHHPSHCPSHSPLHSHIHPHTDPYTSHEVHMNPIQDSPHAKTHYRQDIIHAKIATIPHKTNPSILIE